jgi:fatty acid desaturase
MFPSVPPYYLPELHKLLQKSESYRNSYTLRKSYSKFLAEYWCQISNNAEPEVKSPSEQTAGPQENLQPNLLRVNGDTPSQHA